MHDVGLEEYTLYKYTLACNEIVWKLYAHLQPVMGDQAAFSTIKGEEIPFTWAKILNDIPIPDMREKKLSFFYRANEIPSGSYRFWELCFNISNYNFSENFLKSGYLYKPFILASLFTKYNNASSSMIIELYLRGMLLLSMILERCIFDVTFIIHSSVIHCIAQDHEHI